jgi:hypothetical protein
MRICLPVRTLLVSVCLLAAAIDAGYAQDSTALKKAKRDVGSGLYIRPTSLVYPEVILSYEQITGKHSSLMFSLGYKIANTKANDPGYFGRDEIGAYFVGYLANKFLSGIYASVAPTWYPDGHRSGFFRAELFYRHMSMEPRRVLFDDQETYSHTAIRSENIQSVGVKLVWGPQFIWDLGKRSCISLKPYGGIGGTWNWYHFENKDVVVNSYPAPQSIPDYNENGQARFLPALVVGAQLGLARLKAL